MRGSTPQRTRRLAILAVLGVGFIVVAAVLYYPDYILAGRRFPAFYYGREAGGGGDLGIGSPSLLKGLLAYPQEMAWHTVGLLGTLALLPAAVLFLRDRQNRHRSVLIVWALVPYIVLNISLKKWGYYLSNIFPALAVITAAGIMSIKIRWLRNALAALLVLAGIVGMDARSFYLDAMRWPSIIGVSYGHPNPYVRRPGQQSMAMLYDHIADLIQDGLADVERPDGVLRIGLLKVPAFGSSLIDYRLKQREPLISAEAAIDEHTGEAGQLSRFDVLIVVWPSDLVFKSGARDHQPFGEGIVPMSREELVSIAESDGSFVRAGQRGPLIFFEKHH